MAPALRAAVWTWKMPGRERDFENVLRVVAAYHLLDRAGSCCIARQSPTKRGLCVLRPVRSRQDHDLSLGDCDRPRGPERRHERTAGHARGGWSRNFRFAGDSGQTQGPRTVLPGLTLPPREGEAPGSARWVRRPRLPRCSVRAVRQPQPLPFRRAAGRAEVSVRPAAGPGADVRGRIAAGTCCGLEAREDRSTAVFRKRADARHRNIGREGIVVRQARRRSACGERRRCAGIRPSGWKAR